MVLAGARCDGGGANSTGTQTSPVPGDTTQAGGGNSTAQSGSAAAASTAGSGAPVANAGTPSPGTEVSGTTAQPPTTPQPPVTQPPPSQPPVTQPPPSQPPVTQPPPQGSGLPSHVFVVALENEPASAIYGNKNAPYINGQLLAQFAHATAFTDPLPDAIPSEPHYVWMEAGTNQFGDATFTTDADPSASNSTAGTAHLVSQMRAASPAVSWMSYQEGLSSSTGACPVSSSGFYAAKHDPFVFFQDVAGSPPSASNAFCAQHHKPFTALAQDLAQNGVAQYNFISPNLCNDMHGGGGCPSGDPIALGDQWLATNLPPIIDFVRAQGGVIFIVWDEPEGGSNLIPFIAIGPTVKPGYAGSVAYTHSSLTRTVEKIFGLPVLPAVASANDFADLFAAGL
jgi:hypothetical protein